ncbi:MAG: glycosyltransferase [Gemmatimonadetes bacterium]|nr:glycosyltransferase [Gemmatimonadota bacterium]
MLRLAVISVHGCPTMRAGETDAGGMNIYVLETARRLAAWGVRVDVFSRRHDPADPQVIDIADGARVVHICAGPVETGKEDVYDFLPDFWTGLEEFRRSEGASYDLVSSHYWLSGLVGLEAARRWGVPHVSSFHTLAEVKRRARPGERDMPERADAERRIAACADRIVVWTEHERQALCRLYGADPSQVVVIPPGVDTERFRPLDMAESRRRLGVNGDRVLLYVGRLERLKGLDILFRALASLEEAGDVRLLVVGGSDGAPELSRLQRLAGTLHIRERVDFLGSVDQACLAAYYSCADVCVLPSYYESFGLAALEAAACGRPVVASKVGGLPSVVRDGETGYLVGWRCPGPFVDRLELLLANDRLRRDMGEAARIHAQTLTWETCARRLLRLYECMVGRNGKQAGGSRACVAASS